MTSADFHKLVQDPKTPPAMRAAIVRQLHAPAPKSAATKRIGPSSLEQKWDLIWEQVDGPPLEPEAAIVAGRKWKFDRVHRESKVAIELHGGVYQQGRHTQGSGFREDRNKMTTAQEQGWLVYELTPKDATHDWARRILKSIRQRGGTRPSR